jgi:hypothetical protein
MYWFFSDLRGNAYLTAPPRPAQADASRRSRSGIASEDIITMTDDGDNEVEPVIVVARPLTPGLLSDGGGGGGDQAPDATDPHYTTPPPRPSDDQSKWAWCYLKNKFAYDAYYNGPAEHIAATYRGIDGTVQPTDGYRGGATSSPFQ